MVKWEQKQDGVKKIATLSQDHSHPIAIKEKESKEKKRKCTKRTAFVPPTLDEVRAYFREKGYREDVGERAFNYYNESNWHNKDGKPIKNWKQTMIGVWFKDDNKAKQQTNGAQKKRHDFT